MSEVVHENCLDVWPTIRLHDQLIEQSRRDLHLIQNIGRTIRAAAAERAIRFEGQRELPLALSALLLRDRDVRLIRRLSERLHELTERAINWTLADSARLTQYFPDHRRIAPWFVRTPGLNSWQGYSRYDAVVTAAGTLKFIELNTCCPAGFMHAPDSSEIIFDALRQLPTSLQIDGCEIGTLQRGVLVDELLAVERAAGMPEQLVAILNDENRLCNEVNLMADAFRQRGRDVVTANAADLTYNGTTVQFQGRPVSLAWNKIRVSTANSPNHCWKAGFEKRYAGFLNGLRDGAIVSMNNPVAATIAEDKGLLGLMYESPFRNELSENDRQFIDDHVLWTARLVPGTAKYQGDDIDLLPFVQQHRERFVIKPANEGRGFGVTVGLHASECEWETACQPTPDLPCVVQEYAEPITLPIIAPGSPENPELVVQQMKLTIAMGVIRGRYSGLFCRVAAGPVTNVGKSGMIQAVLVNRSSQERTASES